ncbi:MAG: hypothetical protein IPI67_33455 [Myxococcales bacterium]|nr:hypothetical protein [Myxococcales bacterium]
MLRWSFILSSVLAVTACGGDDAAEPGSGGSAGNSGTGAGAGVGGAGGSTQSGGAGGVTQSGGSAGVAGVDAGVGGTGGVPPDAAADVVAAPVTLLEQSGVVFTPASGDTLKKLDVGAKGTSYGWVRVQFDVKVGDWQPELPDEGTPDRTEHILFGLFRANQTKSDQRYLMGSAAVTFATKAPHFRMFGRNSIGPGYTTYTSWSTTYAWKKDGLYHLDCLLDGVLDVQRCELSLGGAVVKQLQGTVPYLDPAAHLSSGFYIELGTGNPGDIEASPIGWTFSNLLVTAGVAP